MAAILVVLLSAILAGSLVYCVLVLVAVRSYLAVRPAVAADLPPISILTPLAGADLGLEANLRAPFRQDYPRFEVVFAVRHENDPAVAVARRLMAGFPRIDSRLIVTGEPACPNAKVYSLEHMVAAARYDLLVMNDSDVRVGTDMLRVLAAEFADPSVGLSTCPYRAVPGDTWASRLEAIGMNSHFFGGVLVARMLEGMRFALGPSLTVRRDALERIGGIRTLDSYLAEDFVLGQRVADAGYKVLLSSYVVEHHIGAARWRSNLAHRLRWVRSTRRSRPAGYLGELFTGPLPVALAVLALRPAWWPFALAAFVLRACFAWAVAWKVLRDPLCRRYWWAVAVEDLLGFGVWLAGFFGNHIVWRGRRYRLHPDGRFELVP